MKIYTILVVIFCLQNSFSQYDASTAQSFKYAKNTLDVVYGTFGFTGALTTSYQRFLLKQPKVINLFLRLGFGKQFGFDVEENEDREVYLLNVGLATGRRKHHFECGLGIVNDFVKNERYTNFLEVSGFVGYRIQSFRSKSPFVFRAGIGYPETLYMGFGLSF